MKRTRMLFVLSVLWGVISFSGCDQNPAKPDSDSSGDSVDYSASMFALLDSWSSSDSTWTYELGLACRAFVPAISDSAALLGFSGGSEWNNWKKGIIGKKNDGYWVFDVTTKNTSKTINFCRASNWAQLDSLKKSGYFVASSSGGNLAVVFKNGKIGKATTSDSTVNSSTSTDTVYIKQIIIISNNGTKDTTLDTTSTGDTVSNTSTVVKTVEYVYGDEIIKFDSPVSLGNGIYQNKVSFSAAIIKTLKKHHGKGPFAIGLPSWDTATSLGTLSNGYYPLTVKMKDGIYTFSAGGDSSSYWADSSIIKKTNWGFKTSSGWIMKLHQIKGHVFPSKVYDSIASLLSYDTVVVRDTASSTNTIIDSIFVFLKGDSILVRDTVRDTITDTVKTTDSVKVIKITKDSVSLSGRIIYDTIKVVKGDTVSVKDTVSTAYSFRKDTVIDSTVKVYTVDTSWVDTNKLKGVVNIDSVMKLFKICRTFKDSAAKCVDTSYDTLKISTVLYQYSSDTVSFVLKQYGTTVENDTTIYYFGITTKIFDYTGNSYDSAALSGVDSWSFYGKADGYFIFHAKMVKGKKYNLNFYNGSVWAKQEILLQSPWAIKSGNNCDIVCTVDGSSLVKY
jgi:hypothetical protein